MSNPKVYFKYNKNKDVLIPVLGLKKDLDKIFLDEKILNKNKEGYNNYTLDFIRNCDPTDIFWSTEYSWDNENKIFNFYELKVCNEGDYINMSTEPCTFDPKINYTYGDSKNDTKKGTNFILDLNKKYPCPDISTGFYIEDRKWKILVRNILKHQNTMLTGPTGTGKTDIIIRICEALGIPCHIYDMGAMIDPLTDLLGSHRLENGTSKFDYSKFVQDIQEPGVILLDEISRAPAMTNNILFPCLDMRRMLPVEIADSNGPREIPVHPECTFIATANIGSEYAGTNDLDCALENRFMTIQVDYLPQSIEAQVINIRTGCDMAYAEKIVNVANTLREKYLTGIISKTISTRETILCGELIVDGFSLIEAINFAFTEKYSKNGDEPEYDIVKKIIIGF